MEYFDEILKKRSDGFKLSHLALFITSTYTEFGTLIDSFVLTTQLGKVDLY